MTDYISVFTAEEGRQPTYEEYSQVMTGFTPEQIPVLNGLARAFGVFDHWFCEVPSQTFTNRSFWTAATASGNVVNQPAKNFLFGNDNRLEQHGKTWKVYVAEPDRFRGRSRSFPSAEQAKQTGPTDTPTIPGNIRPRRIGATGDSVRSSRPMCAGTSAHG